MGTNRLIADGAVPVCELVDVLLAAGWSGRGSVAAVHPASADGADGAASPLLDVLCWQPLTADEIIDRSGMEITACLAEMTRLEAEGHLVRRGPYLERCTTGGTVHG
jgi:predicted Rossmann fold nucleotide-binding protein DprA/Smf involved in DNA uptake